uniref:Mitogen-activated protein kinase 7 n=1 Tax=Pyropia yezoensis TaxID=2788 RepID=A0A0D5ZBL9_PYRYE|nr:mitogen-activated protein kinase 7 [Neopyropia yezoensis]AYN44121.1 mitogen-activated protein kinase 7 [Neopyropia yezoensis]|eukprot:contig_13940_g3357
MSDAALAGVPGGPRGGVAEPLVTRPFNVLGTRFECPVRYTLIKPIGQGAYGIVCSAHDNLTGEKVAIKKISSILDNAIDCKRTLREMKLLRHFSHENVIVIKDVYLPSSDGLDFQDVYTVTELMDTDLHQIITSNQQLSDEHCQYFTYQILRALKHIHSAHVLHRDLKPSNILLNGNCDLKICDFGLARVANPDDHAGFLTAYVATRWYRAPEIMLSWREYTNAVDMWSVGCMLAEIIGRKPLFPGRDYIHQLKLVTDTIGTPSSEDIQYINSARARRYIESLPPKAKVEMGTLFPAASDVLRDLLDRMLIFDPRRRITVEEALEHPYLTSLHDPEDEPTCASVFYFPFEHQEPNAQQLRQLILEEFYVYYPHMRAVHSMHPKGYPP